MRSFAADLGSIPANTGEPSLQAAVSRRSRVYPREYGGTRCPGCRYPSRWGLSPRIRGNRDKVLVSPQIIGSIPANTGEPAQLAESGPTTKVYPREYGGTCGSPAYSTHTTGLSPRIRGNPQVDRHQIARIGSIPANTGEPFIGLRRWSDRRVYPREYGGTASASEPRSSVTGLSPRIRGNRVFAHACLLVVRSIPANTGEP